jgi:hypothetical protein
MLNISFYVHFILWCNTGLLGWWIACPCHSIFPALITHPTNLSIMGVESETHKQSLEVWVKNQSWAF